MPGKVFLKSSTCPYHITVRCRNSEEGWFGLPLENVWNVYSDYLHFVHHAFRVEIQAFTLLQNSFRMLVVAPEGNISEAMRYALKGASLDIGRQANRINQIYVGRFHRCLIQSPHHFKLVYKDLYRSHLKMDSDLRVENYRFSALHGLLGKSRIAIPLADPLTLSSNFEQNLDWLNQPISAFDQEAIRVALRRGIFKLPKMKSGGGRNPLEYRLN